MVAVNLITRKTQFVNRQATRIPHVCFRPESPWMNPRLDRHQPLIYAEGISRGNSFHQNGRAEGAYRVGFMLLILAGKEDGIGLIQRVHICP